MKTEAERAAALADMIRDLKRENAKLERDRARLVEGLRVALKSTDDFCGACPECGEPCRKGMIHDKDCWVGHAATLIARHGKEGV